MKKFPFGKKLSRVGKILLVSVLSVAILLCTVVTSLAQDTEAVVGYDTLNTHVYSPMDIIDGSTADTSSPAMKNGAYDSSVWKFAAKADGESFFKTSDGTAAPVINAVYGGVQISWNAFDEGVYTVLIYGDNGAYKKEFTTSGTSITLSDLTLNNEYSVQVVGASHTSEIANYTNDRIGTEVFRELPVLETGDYDMDAIHRKPVMYNGEGNINYFIQLDEAGKEALNANGALIIEVKSDIDTTNQGYFELADNPNQDKVYYNDCWVAMNTFIYPTADSWKTVTTARSDYYSDTSSSMFYMYGGTKINSNNLTTIGVSGSNYKGAHNFINGYIVLPLDDFASEELSVDLIENTKNTGKLRMSNVVYNYYARYIKASGVEDTFGSSQSTLLDRSIAFNVYVVSDYEAYVANHITSEVNTTVSYSENVIMTNGAVVNNESVDDYIPFTANTLSSEYAFYCTTQAYTNVNNTYKQRTIEYTAAEGETMTFGFTAPKDGTYEIAAPLGVTSAEDATIKYAVVKTDADGNRTVIQKEQTYAEQNRFCDLLVELKTGETVWFEVTATAGTVIDIGIPQAILLSDDAIVANEDGTTTYKFRSLDYLENKNSSGIDYTTRSTTANTKAAWEVGYFSDTVSKTDAEGNAVYEYNNIVLPTAKNQLADSTLLNAMKSYEIIKNGAIYNSLDVKTAANGDVSEIAGSGSIGSYYPYASSRTTYSDPLSTVLTAQANCFEASITDSNGNSADIAVGHFSRFTAPVSGNALIYLNTNAESIALAATMRLVVMHNNKVLGVANTKGTSAVTFTIDVNAGDEITLVYYGYTDKNGLIPIGCPWVEITDSYGSVSYDAKGGEYTANDGQLLVSGTQTVLPEAVKKNTIFKGWSIGENVYKANDSVTVNTDMLFVALYDYYGDIDGSESVGTEDLVKYRKILLGTEIIADEDIVIADVNADSSVNILDLIRIKKWLAGVAVTLGEA